jgi:hypothetical protein
MLKVAQPANPAWATVIASGSRCFAAPKRAPYAGIDASKSGNVARSLRNWVKVVNAFVK